MHKRLGSLLLSLFLVTGFYWTITTGEVHAYIDIGTGTLMIQALLASLFGSLFAIKVFWRRIVDKVNGFISKDNGTIPPGDKKD